MEKSAELSLLQREVAETRRKHPTLSDDNAFVTWFLQAALVDGQESVVKDVIGGPGDKGVDAVFVDHPNKKVFVLQGKFRMRRVLASEDFLFVDQRNRVLKQRHLLQILHRLSRRVGLPAHRKIHPHALRHFAATSWLRNGVGLDEVRRLLGHESLNTTLRYSSLVARDLQQAHKKAAAIERMGL